jgi:hypothetical protein
MTDADEDPYEYDSTAEQRLKWLDAWLDGRDVMDLESAREAAAYTQREHDQEAQPSRAVAAYVAFLTERHMARPHSGTLVFGTHLRDLGERIVGFYGSHVPVDVLDLETGDTYTARPSLRLEPSVPDVGVGFIL